MRVFGSILKISYNRSRVDWSMSLGSFISPAIICCCMRWGSEVSSNGSFLKDRWLDCRVLTIESFRTASPQSSICPLEKSSRCQAEPRELCNLLCHNSCWCGIEFGRSASLQSQNRWVLCLHPLLSWCSRAWCLDRLCYIFRGFLGHTIPSLSSKSPIASCRFCLVS